MDSVQSSRHRVVSAAAVRRRSISMRFRDRPGRKAGPPFSPIRVGAGTRFPPQSFRRALSSPPLVAVFRGRPLSPSRDAFFCSLAAGTLLTRLASFVFNLPIEKRRKIRPWGHGLFCRHLACEGTRTSEWRWTDAAQIRSQTCRRNYGGSWLAGWTPEHTWMTRHGS